MDIHGESTTASASAALIGKGDASSATTRGSRDSKGLRETARLLLPRGPLENPSFSTGSGLVAAPREGLEQSM